MNKSHFAVLRDAVWILGYLFASRMDNSITTIDQPAGWGLQFVLFGQLQRHPWQLNHASMVHSAAALQMLQ